MINIFTKYPSDTIMYLMLIEVNIDIFRDSECFSYALTHQIFISHSMFAECAAESAINNPQLCKHS